MRSLQITTMVAVLLGVAAPLKAADEDQSKQKDEQAARFKKFERTLSGATLTGHFTIDGQDDKEFRKESYTISSVTKLPMGDFWLFKARVKYGGKDVTVPMPLEVKWAGNTAVITLDKVTIPGLGTFNSRVVIDSGKYAGTWTHGKVGGHLFGTVAKLPAGEKQEQ